MPVIIADNEQRSQALRDVKFDYDYPDGIDLNPSGDLHKNIVDNVMNRVKESYDVMSARYPSWKAIDEVLTAYIRSDEAELALKSRDDRKPVSIVVPQSYAMLEILLTYMVAALLESPIFRYEGRGPEDVVKAMLLERVIEQQCYYSKVALDLHTVLRDGFAYGLGACAPVWYSEYAIMEQIREKQTFLDMLLGRSGTERFETEQLMFEGNRVDNIDPYSFLPDPGVAIHKIQKGEYVGWIARDNYLSLLRDERNNEQMFNVRYLGKLGSCISRYSQNDSTGRRTKTGVTSPTTSTVSRPVDVIYMYIDIIPREWKLPGSQSNRKGEYPETWLFAVAADQVVISARPLNLNHGRKPVVTFAPDSDGYTIAPVSKLEIVHGLQEVLNWLFNSHITNVRKSINDMLIVDPSLINMNDLKDPQAGKLIRMRRAAWGRGLENAVKQLKVDDITRGNVADASIVIDLIKNTSGAIDAISGFRRKTSERVTATEVQGDRTSGLSRLEKLAKIAGLQLFQDLGFMLASQTQQLMSEETYVKVVGDWSRLLADEYGIEMGRVRVTPDDLLMIYDVVVKDGTVPGGEHVEVWTQLLPTLMGDQEIRQEYDIPRIVRHIMRAAGAKDVDQFRRRQMMTQGPAAQVMPNEQVANEVQAGNLVPMEAAGGTI